MKDTPVFNLANEDFAYAALISYSNESQRTKDALVEVQQICKDTKTCIKALLRKEKCLTTSKDGDIQEYQLKTNMPCNVAVLAMGLISQLDSAQEVVKARVNKDLSATLFLLGFPEEVALGSNEVGVPFEITNKSKEVIAVMKELPRDAGNYFRKFMRITEATGKLSAVQQF